MSSSRSPRRRSTSTPGASPRSAERAEGGGGASKEDQRGGPGAAAHHRTEFSSRSPARNGVTSRSPERARRRQQHRTEYSSRSPSPTQFGGGGGGTPRHKTEFSSRSPSPAPRSPPGLCLCSLFSCRVVAPRTHTLHVR